MKKYLLITFITTLVGCNQTVTGNDMEKFLELCKPYGGVEYVVARDSGDNLVDIAHCREMGVSIRGEE